MYFLKYNHISKVWGLFYKDIEEPILTNPSLQTVKAYFMRLQYGIN